MRLRNRILPVFTTTALLLTTLGSASAQEVVQGPAQGGATSSPSAILETDDTCREHDGERLEIKEARRCGCHEVGLREDDECEDREHEHDDDHEHEQENGAGNAPTGGGGGTAAPLSTPTLGTGFIGIPDIGAVIPPDPHLAAGPNHLVAVVNREWAIFDKQGNNLYQIDADSFFDPTILNASPFDPQVVYDHHANRFVMVWVGGNLTTEAYYLIAVSDDSNPLGTWYSWALPGNANGATATNNFNDYPKIGVDEKAIYVTANMFDMTTHAFDYSKLRVIEKTQLYSNTSLPVTWTDFWDLRDPGSPSVRVPTVIPAVDFFDAGVGDNTEFLISDSPFTTSNHMTVWTLSDPIGSPSLTGVNVSTASKSSPPNAAQLGGGQAIDVGGRRVRNAVYRDGSIWTAHSVAGGTGNAYTMARYVRIATATKTLLEDVTFGQDGFYHYYPAIQVDSNLNMIMGYSRSGPTLYAEAAFTGRRNTDPAGQLAPSTRIKAGEANYVKTFGGTRNRWGDYSGIALDPSTDSIWMMLEYAGTNNMWGTWIGEASFATTPVAPVITSTANTAATVGQAYSYDIDDTVNATGTAPITFAKTFGPTAFTVTTAGVVSWTPLPGDVGSHSVTISATNAAGFTTQTYTIDVAAAPPPSWRINIGGGDYTDNNGDLFEADRAFVTGSYGYVANAGTVLTRTFTQSGVSGTTDDLLYQAERGDITNPFSYVFDGIDNGDYDVTLYFMEPVASAADLRIFDVTVEGVVELDDLDVFAAAGGRYAAYSTTIRTTVTDGRLDVAIIPLPNRGHAIASAIAVVGLTPPPTAPDIALSDPGLDFGTVTVGTFSETVVTVSNTGTADLDVSSLTTTNPRFSVIGPATPFTITPGGADVDVTVRFTPLTGALVLADLDIVSNDPDEGTVQVSLSGQGVLPVPDIAVSTTSLGFGSVDTGDSGDLTVSVSNTGTADLVVSSLTPSTTAFSVVSPAGGFTITTGGPAVVVTVRFSPTAAGLASADLDIASNDPDEAVVTISLAGTGVEPDISLSATSLAFGAVGTGTTKDLTVDVGNTGAADLQVTSLSTTNPLFSIVSPATPFTVAAGGGPTTVTVRFSPVNGAPETGDLDIVSDDPDEGSVAVGLSGQGVVPVPDIALTTTSLGFGDVNTGGSADLTVSVSNTGTADLVVSSLTPSTAAFSVVSPAGGFTITPGGPAVVVTVRFSPTAPGTANADLDIASNDPDEGTVTVALTGTGVEPDIAVSPTTLAFGTVTTGATADLTVDISNTGDADLDVTALGTTNGVFTIVSPATPFTIPVGGGARTVTVRFSPTAVGVVNANLQITSNDPDEGLTAVSLGGEGVAPPPVEFRINVGGGNFTDANGDLFVADKAFVAGDFGYLANAGTVETRTFTQSGVSGTTDDLLYQAERGDKTNPFSYAFDGIPNGDYDVTLYFMEPVAPAANMRIFDVTIEGVLELDDLDVFAAAGGRYAAYSTTIRTTVTDGRLDVTYTPLPNRGHAIASAIAVVQQ